MGALWRSSLGLVALAATALVIATGAAAGPALTMTTPLPYDVFNTCTGEMITGTANAHSVFTDNLSSGGVLQLKMQLTIDGFQAVGVSSGKKYVVQDTFSEEMVFTGTTTEDTFNMTVHYVRVGEDGGLVAGDDDFYLAQRAHITVNANGMPVFRMTTSDMPCR
jgi:hypothetical protein